MSKLQKYLFLVSIFLISFLTANFFKYQTHILTKKIPVWNEIPIIVNCYVTLFPENRINESVDFWAKNGYNTYIMSVNPIEEVCKHENLKGFILIKKADNEDLEYSTLGFTRIKSEYGKIKSATIYLRFGTFYYPRLLEHELGHALGLPHIKIPGNIMHPIYDNTGNTF